MHYKYKRKIHNLIHKTIKMIISISIRISNSCNRLFVCNERNKALPIRIMRGLIVLNQNTYLYFKDLCDASLDSNLSKLVSQVDIHIQQSTPKIKIFSKIYTLCSLGLIPFFKFSGAYAQGFRTKHNQNVVIKQILIKQSP